MTSFGDDQGAAVFGSAKVSWPRSDVHHDEQRVVGLEGVGIADCAFSRPGYAFERIQGPTVGGTDPDVGPRRIILDVQRMLLTMELQTQAARALAYDRTGDPGRRASIPTRQPGAGASASSTCSRRWSKLGAPTSVSTSPTPRSRCTAGSAISRKAASPSCCARRARIAAIYEGTNGIQVIDLVSRKVAGDDGLAVRELVATIFSADAESAAVGDADVEAIRPRLLRSRRRPRRRDRLAARQDRALALASRRGGPRFRGCWACSPPVADDHGGLAGRSSARPVATKAASSAKSRAPAISPIPVSA